MKRKFSRCEYSCIRKLNGGHHDYCPANPNPPDEPDPIPDKNVKDRLDIGQGSSDEVQSRSEMRRKGLMEGKSPEEIEAKPPEPGGDLQSFDYNAAKEASAAHGFGTWETAREFEPSLEFIRGAQYEHARSSAELDRLRKDLETEKRIHIGTLDCAESAQVRAIRLGIERDKLKAELDKTKETLFAERAYADSMRSCATEYEVKNLELKSKLSVAESALLKVTEQRCGYACTPISREALYKTQNEGE